MLPSPILKRLPQFLFVTLCWLVLAVGVTQAQQETTKLKAGTLTLVADTTTIQAGKPFTVGAHFELDPEWDVYWQFVGDIGQATRIDWELPPGFKAGPLQWPIPVAHPAPGDFLNYVYLKETLLFAEITPPADLPPGPIVIKAHVVAQTCNPETCVPVNAHLALSLNAGAPQPANADLFTKWRAQLPKTTPVPFTVKWDRSKADEFSLRIEGLPKEFKAEFFPLPPKGVTPDHPKASEIAADGSRTITFPVKNGGQPNLPWRGVIATAKDDAPREGWVIDSTAATSATAAPTTDKPAATTNTTGTTNATNPASTSAAPASSNNSLLAILWSAFLGGLILNLMPCVLPVIALKIFGFVQQAGEHPRRVFHLGLAFVGGVFAFFLGLATVVAVLRMNGVGVNWGFQYQHPGILIALIALVFLFGLNLLGVFEIALSGGAASKLSELSGKEGLGGAFFHGVFTTLLGTSCTAPFLGPVLGAAFAAPPHIIYLIFTAIACGMSLPYFLLTAKPAWLRFLPKPGRWMNLLKQFMGFVMLGVVVWLLGVFGKAAGLDALTVLSAFLLVLGVVCWIYGSFDNRPLAWVSILVLLAVSFLVYRYGGEKSSGIAWQPLEQRSRR
ncbi:cytochrome c biogenesis protein transmembrane region [Chthoniobacter flavus Ellin428]|uniref:Cytochrome c biogenesis protein transmembrane region n=1 Tax=Chthoniobacter flavus Ellin428 TaxID=497964 RepID=B4CVC5_9BACT|nr:protein-disulfide reductase DsbD domain-containing protein [Chthoniobacter flavus]EDY21367.1 cytochrome c biogenesis protein transmembrane region [Chthoniobacter flavus Ellin428]